MCDIKQEESHKKGESFVVSYVMLTLLSCAALDLKSEYNLQIVETKAVYAE